MKRQAYVIKELYTKTSEISQIEGCIPIDFKLKEIQNVRYETLPVRTIIGKNVIAFFGEVKIKIVGVDEESRGLFLVEHVFHYKGFLHDEIKGYNCELSVNAEAKVLDIFVQIEGPHRISITGIIRTELKVLIEKELSFQEFKAARTPREDINTSEQNYNQAKDVIKEAKNGDIEAKGNNKEMEEGEIVKGDRKVNLMDLIKNVDEEELAEINVDTVDRNLDGSEIYTDIEVGENQNFSIVLE